MASVHNTNTPFFQSDPTMPVKKVVGIAALDVDAQGLFIELDEQSLIFSTYGPDDFSSCGEGDLASMSCATTAFGSRQVSEFSSPESSMDLSYAVASFRPDGFDKKVKKVLLLPDDSQWLESQEPVPSPGLTKPVDITAKLSLGSEKHSLGTCEPCVWYWKPEGCSRGNDCGYCHLCPEGEIKQRKKQKKDAIRRSREAAETVLAETSPELSSEPPQLQEKTIGDQAMTIASEQAESESVEVPGGATAPQLSVGSALHGTGQCEPCAWFWSKGCMRGKDCLRCHLCPEGELKRRKKAKVATLRKDMGKSTEDVVFEPQNVSPPPGLDAPPGFEAENVSPPPGLEAPPGLPAPEKPKSPLVGLPLTIIQPNHTEQEQDGEGSPDADEAFCADRVPQVSEGAKNHSSGTCRPCAWFWRPEGCQNGEACYHCHLCPPGELKARKKMKLKNGEFVKMARGVGPFQ